MIIKTNTVSVLLLLMVVMDVLTVKLGNNKIRLSSQKNLAVTTLDNYVWVLCPGL